MTEVERAVLEASILTAWQAQDGGEAPDLIELSVSSTLALDTSEVARMRQVIAEYVADVSSGFRFAALVALVPGLSLDGVRDENEAA